jgi:cyanamide hydratase
MHGTHMSFEYYGAFKALNFLRDSGASKDQAEAVSEAIIRHADLGETGTLTSLGMLIQLSTVFGKLSFSSPQRDFYTFALPGTAWKYDASILVCLG